ncbi:hypothetical protein BBF96_04335 [Anoxybacter fermentans]|uniref:Major facilitator superfamily (MFS) profile domain-containing protein n=1 Tax=Anoxybacter fermentans TaxID=1323375 RepID=A0A3S9SWM5_9FIRM|nr:MFS transporter [Anoxybacter fermentans]AZR72685.1 hypothetical protein BBF96_04335 [Anoxybacter fermentans]
MLIKLKRERNLCFYFIGLFVSTIGSGISHIALMWVSLELTGKYTTIGAITSANVIILAVFGLFTGVLIDGFNKKKFLVRIDLFKGVLVLIIPFLFSYLGMLNIHLLWIYVILSSFAEVPTNQAHFAIIPSLVKDNKLLVKVNSISTTLLRIGSVLGPAVGGIIVSQFGIATAFLVDALTFFFSAGCLVFLKPYYSTDSISIEGYRQVVKTVKEFKDNIALSFSLILKNVFLRRLTMYNLVTNFIMGPLFILAPIIAKNTGLGAAGYGMLQSLMMIGLSIGGLLITLVEIDFNKVKMLLIGNIGFAGSFLLLVLISAKYMPYVVFFLAGFFLVGGKVFGHTIFQESVPKEHLGKFMGSFGFVGNLVQPVNLWLSTYFIGLGKLNEVLLILSTFSIVVSIYSFKFLNMHYKFEALVEDSGIG